MSVIIRNDVINRIKKGWFVPSNRIAQHSVSVYKNKIEPDGEYFSSVASFSDDEKTVLYWVGNYDKEKYGIRCE